MVGGFELSEPLVVPSQSIYLQLVDEVIYVRNIYVRGVEYMQENPT